MSLAEVDLRPFQRRIRRAEYHAMIAAGLFVEEHVELLYGVLVRRSPQGKRHAYPIRKLNALLVPALTGRAEVLVQLPIAAAGESEPEPDLAIAPIGEYLDDHPSVLYLVIEVAESSLDKDADVKAALYARSGIPAYWLFDLPAGEVIAYTGPRADGTWARVIRHGRDAVLAVPGFDDVRVPLDAVLPPEPA